MKSFAKFFSVLQKCLLGIRFQRRTFKGHLLANNVHMWVSWDVSKCRQSLLGAVQSETHIASSCFWSQQKLDRPEILCFAFALQEGGALLASERTISGQFRSNNSWLCREPHPALIILNKARNWAKLRWKAVTGRLPYQYCLATIACRFTESKLVHLHHLTAAAAFPSGGFDIGLLSPRQRLNLHSW